LARKILLADDSVTAQNMGRKILADAGYDVITVNNGSAALKRITETKPDLIVLDVYMPGYSGLEVCQRIKDAAETEHIPVLLTVGKLEPFKPEEARRVRADGHIVKPFEASELLTAITRLEDRMVPQQSDGRFGSVSGVERFGGDGNGRRTENNGDADAGWKSRLRFPSKKKKEEPEPEPEDVTGTAPFRDFRKAKSKAAANTPFAVKAPPPPGQEPGLVPDIPRDITPDELDALSALAAKLDGPIPAAENIVPLAEAAPTAQSEPDQTKSNIAPVEAVSTETSAAEGPKTYAEIVAAAAEAKREKENKTELSSLARAVESAVAPADAPSVTKVAGVELKNEVEFPVQQVEVTSGPVVALTEAAAAIPPQEAAPIPQPHIQESEEQPAEIPVVAATVDTASLAQEPAPIDRNDEPMFTLAQNAVEQAEPVADKVEEKIEPKALEAVTPEKAEPSVAETASEPSKEQQVQPPKTEASLAVAAQTEKSAIGDSTEELKRDTVQPAPVAASTQESAISDDLSPSDAELAQALRLLTPAGGNSEFATIPSHGTLIAAGQLLAEEALRNAESGPRWIAQPVALSPEESAISLEAEMFRAFMTVPPATFSSLEPSRMTGVSAIEAAVENRLAAAELASAKVSSDPVLEQKSEQAPSVRPPEIAAAEAAEVAKAVSTEAVPQAEASEAGKNKPETIEVGKTEAEKPEVEAKISEEETASIAAASSQSVVEAAAEPSEQPSSITTAPATAIEEENQDSSSEPGSEESMAKDIKAKSGNSNWHQIRTAPAGAASDSNVVEAAKQAEGAPEESPKAMAAVAAEGSSAAAPDASTIASIVDSVMADLRPKIVEEIAKKLAGK
jgi:CheY-like chemotaxis protein